MRILVISGSKASAPDPVYPMGAAIIATALEKTGHAVDWFDALRHQDTLAALSERIEQGKPEAFLLSIRNIDSSAFPHNESYFETHQPIAELCRQKSDAPLILGGSGFSLMPEAFMDFLKADAGVVGEAVTACLALVERLQSGEKVSGIVRSKEEKPTFLSPKRSFFDADWYYEYGGVANIQTKRGCSFQCVYCTYPLLEGRRVHCAPPEEVAEQIAEMTRSGIRDFFFVDGVFNRPENHAAAICEEIIRRELDITFTAYFAPTGDLKEFPSLLKRAGCNAVELGTDSLADPVLDKLQKGFTVAQAISFSERIAREGIPQCYNLILGAPGETQQTMRESIRQLDRLSPKAVIVTLGLRVYPGTPLVEMAREKTDLKVLDFDGLKPRFYLEEAVAENLIEQASSWIDERAGWICPGLQKRYNARYLERQRLHRHHKGVLWTLF